MKLRNKIGSILLLFICGVFYSCASLQEDILISSDVDTTVYAETKNYEEKFREFDSNLFMGTVVSVKELESFVSDIDKRLSKHCEPVLSARLQAFQGLALIMEKKNKKAQEIYESAKVLHSGDEYVLLLNARLQKTSENSLEKINEYLMFDTDNPVFLLEKALLLYKAANYSHSVAAFDDAFLGFEKEGKDYYRERYSGFREGAWKYYQSGATGSVSTANVNLDRMLQITIENTSLLSDFISDSGNSRNQLMKKLEANGFFSAAYDENNSKGTSKALVQNATINRFLCARYLWNLFVYGKGNASLRNAYSKRYSKRVDAVSPVGDIEISDDDFDAVIGVVERDIMHLEDGKNFNGNKLVTELDFAGYVVNCEQALK